MKKIPIELMGVSGDNSSRAPVIWNGLEFVVSSELPVSIFDRVMRASKETNLVLKYELFKAQIVNNTASAQLADLKAWYKENSALVSELVETAHNTHQLLATAKQDINRVYAANESLKMKLADSAPILEKIRNGTLLFGGGNYEVAFNKATYAYTISRKVLPEPKFFGDASVTVTKKDKAVVIDFDPTMDFKILAGKGLFTTTLEHYSTINMASIVQGTRGVLVKENRDHFVVSISELLLTGKSSNLRVTYDLYGGFRIALNSSFKYSLDFKFYQGYGIEITYDEVLSKYVMSLADIAPRFVTGANVTLTPILVNGVATKNYNVKFALPAFVNSPDIDAEWPLVAKKQTATGSPQKLHTLEVDPDFSTSVNNSLMNINRSLVNSDVRLTNVTLDMLSAEAKQWLKCPILNLFRLASTDTVSATAKASMLSDSVVLVNLFGAAPKLVTIPVDVLPLMATNAAGNGIDVSATFAFNAFPLLQEYVRKRSGDAAFLIADVDKGKRYQLLEFAVDTALMAEKTTGQMKKLDYNMGWVYDLSAVGSKVVPLTFSAADLDFYKGKNRNGQANTTKVTLTSDQASDVSSGYLRIVISSHTKAETATTVRHTISIQDNYSGSTFTVIWSKPLIGINPDADLMTEGTSVTIPPVVRFVARMAAAWGHTANDSAKLLAQMKVINDADVANNTDVYFNRLSDQSYIAATGLVNNQSRLVLQSIGTDGKVTVKLDTNTAINTLDAKIGMTQLLNGARAMLTFKIHPLVEDDFSIIDGECNWDHMAYNIDVPCATLGADRTKIILDRNPVRFSELTGKTMVEVGLGNSGGVNDGGAAGASNFEATSDVMPVRETAVDFNPLRAQVQVEAPNVIKIDLNGI